MLRKSQWSCKSKSGLDRDIHLYTSLLASPVQMELLETRALKFNKVRITEKFH